MAAKLIVRFYTYSLFTISLFLFAKPVQATKSELEKAYENTRPNLEKNVYGIPIYINSNTDNSIMLGEVYGRLAFSFGALRQALIRPSHWCEITPLHLNIKACTYQAINDHCLLTIYTGRKFYEKADDVYKLTYKFELVEAKEDYFHIRLSANDGPMGTKDYLIEAEAIPLDDKSSFIHFSYSYKYNLFTQLGMDTYLATLGSGKVGFSVIGQDKDGKPVYIEGIRGIIERNSVRYYLAIQSYLDTLTVADDQRFLARINHWFDMTEKYHQQLYEYKKQDYIEYKQMEHKDQIRLQEQSNQNDIKAQSCL